VSSLAPESVCAILVTRGDVDMQPIIASLPREYEIVVWDNSTRPYDAGVFGRYLAIAETYKPVVYVQDDDCIVTCHDELLAAYAGGVVVGNAFDDAERLARYHDTTLLGWGAIFDRDLPWRAFQRYALHFPLDWEFFTGLGAEIAFPMLSKTKTILHGVEWLREDGEDVLMRDNRMWRQPDFYEATAAAMEKARYVRDAR
jgi:hypothetical protein